MLARKSPSGEWSGFVVNSLHNGNNPLECQRIKREHAGEDGCVSDNRVIGYLAPTRGKSAVTSLRRLPDPVSFRTAMGDTWLKVPSIYTRRVFGEYMPDWMTPLMVEQYAARILTPPYVSDMPDVHHYAFERTLDRQESFLILSSDGLLDLYDNIGSTLSDGETAERWVRIVGNSLKKRKELGIPKNLAFDLLRDAIGGDDIDLASRNLTLEMDDKWMDDVTVLVQRF